MDPWEVDGLFKQCHHKTIENKFSSIEEKQINEEYVIFKQQMNKLHESC